MIRTSTTASVGTYALGFCHIQHLHALAHTAKELAAIKRLSDFRGTTQDIRVAADIYDRGDADDAAMAVSLRVLASEQLSAKRRTRRRTIGRKN